MTIMKEGGLRRSEALWLTKESVSADYTYLSVQTQEDEETDETGTLKTGFFRHQSG